MTNDAIAGLLNTIKSMQKQMDMLIAENASLMEREQRLVALAITTFTEHMNAPLNALIADIKRME